MNNFQETMQAAGLSIKNVNDSSPFNILVYGSSGVGKTRLAGTTELDERTKPAFVIDIDGGTKSLSGMGIERIPINSIDKFDFVMSELKKGNHKYKTIILDSASELQKLVFTKILDDERNNPKRKGDEDSLQIQDYGKSLRAMTGYITALRNMPYNVIVTALGIEDTDIYGNKTIMPSFQGQFKYQIAALFDIVGYMEFFTPKTTEGGKANSERRIILKGGDVYIAKFRTPIDVTIPATIVLPTITKLLDVFEGKYIKTN